MPNPKTGAARKQAKPQSVAERDLAEAGKVYEASRRKLGSDMEKIDKRVQREIQTLRELAEQMKVILKNQAKAQRDFEKKMKAGAKKRR